MEVKTYQNIRNKHKYIELKRYPSGNYYWKQTIRAVNPLGELIINPVGSRTSRGRFFRVRRTTAMEVLNSDYILQEV